MQGNASRGQDAPRLLVCADEPASTRQHRLACRQDTQSLAGADYGDPDGDRNSRDPSRNLHAEREAGTRPAATGASHAGWNRGRVRSQFIGAADSAADADRHTGPCARVQHSRAHTGAGSRADADTASPTAAHAGAEHAACSADGPPTCDPANAAAASHACLHTCAAGGTRSTAHPRSATDGSSGAGANASAEACSRCAAVSRSRELGLNPGALRQRCVSKTGNGTRYDGPCADPFSTWKACGICTDNSTGSAPGEHFLARRGDDTQTSAATHTCSHSADRATSIRAGRTDRPHIRHMPDLPWVRRHRMSVPCRDAHPGRQAHAPRGGRIAPE